MLLSSCSCEDFLAAENSANLSGRALAHNDRSIQENHHIMTMFLRLSKDQSINIFEVRTAQTLFDHLFSFI